MDEQQLKERYSRQQDIVPAGKIAACKATVVGIGAIGRQAALQLAAIGMPWLQLVDFDFVEPSNLASQGYFEDDLGKCKVEATGNICRQINHNLELYSVNERFRRSTQIGNVVFCCVDNIDVRRLIWQAVKDKVNFFCDGRMSAEVIRVITACDYQSRKYYPSTLFASQEAYVGSCTAKTTIYSANIAAGLMVAQFTKYLRQLPINADIQFNLLSSEISIPGPA
jgi:sulfur carrier protein ThiS adenylyltransferase